MPKLTALYTDLGASPHCRYSTSVFYPVTHNGSLGYLLLDELLEIGRDFSREQVSIARSGDDSPLRVAYAGEDSFSMLETLAKLKLPSSWPSNLGEKVFYLFKRNLMRVPGGPVRLEQLVRPGSEEQLNFVLRRLLEIYDSDEKYHTNSRGTLVGGVFSISR
jgi:hypothetical protein